jgi:hypothetical protein
VLVYRAPNGPDCVQDTRMKSCEKGHLTRDCPTRVGVQKNVCCGGYGKHLTECESKLVQGTGRAVMDVQPRGKVNVVLSSEPLLPHSVEVPHNWTEAEHYPHSSFTFKPAQPLPVNQGAKRKERSKDVESESEEDDEYSSSEDEGKVFI